MLLIDRIGGPEAFAALTVGANHGNILPAAIVSPTSTTGTLDRNTAQNLTQTEQEAVKPYGMVDADGKPKEPISVTGTVAISSITGINPEIFGSHAAELLARINAQTDTITVRTLISTPNGSDYVLISDLSLIDGAEKTTQDSLNQIRQRSQGGARLSESVEQIGDVEKADTVEDAIGAVIGLISTDADFTVTREQIYTELVIRALDGKPSVQSGILPVLWDDNSLTAYSFRLDGQSVVIEVSGQDLRIDNFREQARSLKENEKKVVSAAADESILLAHDQSAAMNEYARLLESSIQLKANVAIPSGVFSEIKKSEHAEVHAKLLLKNLEWIHSQKWGSDYVFYFDPAEIQRIPKSARQAIERFAERSSGVVVIGERPVNDGRLLFKLFASQADPESFKESHDADNSGVNVNIPVIRGGAVPNWIRYIAEAALFVNEVTSTGTAAELAKAQAGRISSIYMERLNSGLEVPIEDKIALFAFMRGQRTVSGSSFLMKPLRVIAIDALIRGARMAIATIGASA